MFSSNRRRRDAELTEALAASPAVLGLLAGAAPPSRSFGVALVGAPDTSGLLALPGATPLAVDGAPTALAALPGDTVRAVPMLARLGETVMPGLAVGVLARALELETLVLRSGQAAAAPCSSNSASSGCRCPGTGCCGCIRRRPPSRCFRPRRCWPATPRTALRGRLVLLGSTAAEVAPLRPSTLGPFTPSLLLQAAAAAQLAAGWVPMRILGGAWTEAGLAFLLGASAAAAVAWRPGPGLALAALLFLLWPAVVCRWWRRVKVRLRTSRRHPIL